MTASRRNAEQVQAFLDWMRDQKQRSPSTIYCYGRTYSALLDHLGRRTLDQVRLDDLEAFLGRPRNPNKLKGEGPRPATIKREIMELRSLFSWMARRRMIAVDPTELLLEQSPTVHNEDPNPVDEDVWRQLWFSDLLTDDERVAFGLGLYCGLRRAEITGLAAQQFRDAPYPFLAGVKRKGGKRQGLRWRSCVDVYVTRLRHLIGDGSLFLDALARLRADRIDKLALLPWAEERHPSYTTRFVHQAPAGHVNPDLFNRRLTRALRRVGMTGTEATPHQLRHSFCTNLIDAGVPIHLVSRLAGHSSMAITQRYIDLGEDPLAPWAGAGDDGDESAAHEDDDATPDPAKGLTTPRWGVTTPK